LKYTTARCEIASFVRGALHRLVFALALESAMNRFFFNLVGKDTKICDPNGKEFSDLAYAHRHAMLLIHKIAVLDEESDWQGWSIEVTDANNRSVLSVLFPHM
jgi:hypothetical protein